MTSIIVFLVVVFLCWVVFRPHRRITTYEINKKQPIGFLGFLFRVIIIIVVLYFISSV